MGDFLKSTQIKIMFSLLFLMGIIALGSYASLNFEKSAFLNPNPATIMVTGEGEVFAVPDIGTFSFSVTAEGANASEAQEKSGEKVNAILAFLSEQGVEEKDIKTQNYNLYPKWRNEPVECLGGYCPSNRVQDGFEVSQSITVKIRDTENSKNIIAGVGDEGATNISGLNFTVDDTEVLKEEARAAAIVDAREKAVSLANQLGVRIVRLASYNEDGGGYAEPYYNTRAMAFDVAEESSFGGAELPVGEDKTTVRINVVYIVK